MIRVVWLLLLMSALEVLCEFDEAPQAYGWSQFKKHKRADPTHLRSKIDKFRKHHHGKIWPDGFCACPCAVDAACGSDRLLYANLCLLNCGQLLNPHLKKLALSHCVPEDEIPYY